MSYNPDVQAPCDARRRFGLIPFRSPLLRESPCARLGRRGVGSYPDTC